MTLADRKAVQITFFTGDPVRSLSISDNDDLAFSRGGDLFRIPGGATAPERIDVDVLHVEFSGDRPGRTTHIDDFVLSPNGVGKSPSSRAARSMSPR